MTQDQVFFAILGILVVASIILDASIPFRSRRRRRSAPQIRGGTGSADDDRAAAIEAFVAGVSVDARGRREPPPAWDPIPSMGVAVRDPELAPQSTVREHAVRPVEDAATWSRAIREESARVARFGHAATVVMAEVPRLQVLSDRLGRGVADRVVTEAARLMVSDTRAVDRVARLGEARFGVLLMETDEIAASDYVERVRAATDRWLESAGLSIRLSVGWASATDGSDVAAAAATAEQRMHEADHGPKAVRITQNRSLANA
jgi:diguanylate cyclase (GGDEF)-like protein